MKRLALLAGFLLLPLGASAADSGLYNLFRAQVDREQSIDRIDTPVIDFVRGIFRDRWELTQVDVRNALQGKFWLACTSAGTSAPQADSNECSDALRSIQSIAGAEQALRTFGRTLQRIATGEELPLSEIPGRDVHLSTDLSGIVNIWRAGTGSLNAGSGSALLRTWTPDENSDLFAVLRTTVYRLNQEYMRLNEEERVALVNRYQYGVRLTRGERQPTFRPPVKDEQSGPGTERQYVFKSWEEIEKILRDAWFSLPPGDALNPPLARNEVAYVLLPDELRRELPENVLLWFRIGPYEGGKEDLIGDAGLAWRVPLEPLLPSLLDTTKGNKPILGGRYPPEPAYDATSDARGNPAAPGTKIPIDGAGLCSMTLGKLGYLCRPLTVATDAQCPVPANANDDAITLVSCTLEEEPTHTVAGADVCRDIAWNDASDRRCQVQFIRGCQNGDSAMAEWKQPDGTIRVCLDERVPGAPLTYVMEHELVHAQQFCPLAPGDPNQGLNEEEQNALCCRSEGEAHLVSCARMIEDGVLKNPDGTPLRIGGVEVTAQTCMEMARMSSCNSYLKRDAHCPASHAFTEENVRELYQKMAQGGNPANVPDTYEKATNRTTMDARAAARLDTIESYDPVCQPGGESTYKNTIGNNACYIGRCVEESLELHRVVAGRAPATVTDEAFPWDIPVTGDDLGTTVRSVPITTPSLPTYRPQDIVRMLDDELCQLQGLPASVPPHLCAFSPARRLELPLGDDGALTAQNLFLNIQDQQEETFVTSQLAAGLGSRIGTDMYGQFLRVGTRTLSEVVMIANTLLRDMLSIRFPQNMCPMSLQ